MSRRVYRAFLFLYPRSFRDRFADDQVDSFADLLDEARQRRGRRGFFIAWIKALTDLLVHGPQERLGALKGHATRTSPDLTPSAPPGGRQMFENFTQDTRLALRTLRQEPGYAVAAILTLALGIGANSAIFSVGSAALMSAAPVTDPESLAAIWTTCRAGRPRCSSSYPDYLDYRDRSTTLDDLAAYALRRASLGDDNGARLVAVQASTGNFFDVVGVKAALGRTFSAGDEQERAAVVVLTDALWRAHFSSDPGVIGHTIRLNGTAFDVIGVTPEGFRGMHLRGGPDAFIPLLSGPALASGFMIDDSLFQVRGSRWIDQLIGRLDEATTIEQARAEMLAISDQLAEEDPGARGPRSITVESARRLLLPVTDDGELVSFLTILGGVVAFTLILACANLANLMLARAGTRRREIGVRLAIGASKGRVVRQMLTESMVVALFGGGAGFLLGNWVLALLGGYELPGGVAVAGLGASMDGRVMLFAFALSLLTGLAFGLVPALQATRTELDACMSQGSRGATHGGGRLRSVLVAAQLALCVILITGSGLFLQALWNGLDTDLGFAADGLAVASLDLGLLHYGPEQGLEFVDALTERLERMPGVVAAGVGMRAPMLPGGTAMMLASVGGYQTADDEELRLEYTFVSEGYLRALGLPLVGGRLFTGDEPAGQRILVINRDMADRWWRGRNPVGGRVEFFSRTEEEAPGDVLGVVANTKWDDGIAADDYPFAYLPLQASDSWINSRIAVLVRTEGDAAALLPVLRSEIAALEPDASLMQLATMEDLLAGVLMPQRMGAQLLSWFGLLALILASVGIYGVVSYTVSQRRHDIGIRIALGAEARRVMANVFGDMMAPVLLGLAAGIGAALMLGNTVAGFLYGVTPRDPATITVGGVGLVAVAALAILLPAWRASRIDPIVALRAE